MSASARATALTAFLAKAKTLYHNKTLLSMLTCIFFLFNPALLKTTKTTCKNNILFLAAKPRGVLESAGVLPAAKKLSMLFSKLILIDILVRSAGNGLHG